MATICDGDNVLMKKGSVLKLVQVRTGRKLFLEKAKFCIDGIIGHVYGGTYEVQNGQLQKINSIDFQQDFDVELDYGTDNRNLKADTENQKLTQDDIQEMKKDFSGAEIVDQLVENSSTFREKTEFSQQKYLKKKHKKFRAIFTVLRPSARLLAEMYYNQGPNRICNLRVDSLAQILERSNVHSGSRLLVCESCLGLVTGAALERMAGNGLLIDFYSGSPVQRPAFSSLNLSEAQMAIMHSFPIEMLASVNSDLPMTDLMTEPVSEASRREGDNKPPKNEDCEDTDANCMDGDDAPQTDSSDRPLPEEQKTDSANIEQHKLDRNSRRELRRQKMEETRQLLKLRNFDGLIVASKFHPTRIVLSLIEFLLPSRPIVVFSAFKEPLVDCYQSLRERKGVIMLTLSETWLREHQVLSNRTHPLVNMSGGGGYLLTAINVEK